MKAEIGKYYYLDFGDGDVVRIGKCLDTCGQGKYIFDTGKGGIFITGIYEVLSEAIPSVPCRHDGGAWSVSKYFINFSVCKQCGEVI